MTHPNPTREFEDIFAQCLELIAKGATVQDCLARYPQQAQELAQPLRVAWVMRQMQKPRLATAKVNAMEMDLRAQFKSQAKKSPAVARPNFWNTLNRAAAGVLIVLFGTLFATSGTVAASANAMPNDLLYSVKRAWENIVLAFANLVGLADDVWLHLAQVRYEELLYLQSKGQLTVEALDAFNISLQTVMLLANQSAVPSIAALTQDAKQNLQPTDTVAVSTVYATTLRLLNASVNTNGVFVLDVRDMPTPTSVPTVVEASATPPPSATSIPTATWTATVLVSPTATPTILASATSRFDATATRTPTANATLETSTATAVPNTATATPTLTPLPLLALTQRVTQGGTPTVTPIVVTGATATPTNGSNVESPFVRETIQAAQMTQTAQAEATESQ